MPGRGRSRNGHRRKHQPRPARAGQHCHCGDRRPLFAASGISHRCQDQNPGSLDRHCLAGSDWYGVADGTGGRVHGAGRISRRSAIGRLRIPSRTGSTDRTVQRVVAGAVLHQCRYGCQRRLAAQFAPCGAGPDAAVDRNQAADAVPDRSCTAGGLNNRSALQLGLVLAAGGEFAFVVFKIGSAQGLFEAGLYDMLVLTITLSMAITPLLFIALARWIKPRIKPVEVPDEYRDIQTDKPRVVIAGMGRMGQIVARILRAQKIPFIALDTAVESIEFSRSFGNVPVFYGDPLRPEILRAAKVDEAEYFVIATDDPDTNIKTAKLIRKLYPHMKIIARARNRQHVHRLMDIGAHAVRETFYSSLEMSRQTLMGLGLTEAQADARISRFKRHDEQVLAAQHEVYDDDAKVLQTAREARADLAQLFEADRLDEEAAKS
ncbi:Glutathione-regulated potassium-efflux system protein [Pseudomonas syringae pv. broussonetiae]|nr:Glutathione-regulated potassium-efflux system protein [Pseudomonas syringae pv. broussonetiae]